MAKVIEVIEVDGFSQATGNPVKQYFFRNGEVLCVKEFIPAKEPDNDPDQAPAPRDITED